jgi:hypothetical protein
MGLTPAIYTVFLPLLPEPQTARFSCGLRCCRLSPTADLSTSFKHPPLSEDVLLWSGVHVGVIVFSVTLEEVEDVFHRKLADGFAALDSSLGEFALGLLQLENALFDRVVDGQTVHGDIDGLIEAMDTVYCLFFDKLYFLLVSVH